MAPFLIRVFLSQGFYSTTNRDRLLLLILSTYEELKDNSAIEPPDAFEQSIQASMAFCLPKIQNVFST